MTAIILSNEGRLRRPPSSWGWKWLSCLSVNECGGGDGGGGRTLSRYGAGTSELPPPSPASQFFFARCPS